MTDKTETPTPVSDRALEMVMRDVLDGMLELSLESAYANSMDFKIIEISAAPEECSPWPKRKRSARSVAAKPGPAADILPFPPLRKAAC